MLVLLVAFDSLDTDLNSLVHNLRPRVLLFKLFDSLNKLVNDHIFLGNYFFSLGQGILQGVNERALLADLDQHGSFIKCKGATCDGLLIPSFSS
jgi:hypothetical protein